MNLFKQYIVALSLFLVMMCIILLVINILQRAETMTNSELDFHLNKLHTNFRLNRTGVHRLCKSDYNRFISAQFSLQAFA